MTTASPQSVCFLEIRTRALDQAKAFYSEVFEWQFTGQNPGPSPGYLFETGADPAGLLMHAPEEIPLAVCPYITVRSCSEVAARAAHLGSQLILEREPVANLGWFSLVVDHWRNELAFWEWNGPAPSPRRGKALNPFVWLELRATNLDAARCYFERLLGWQFEVSPTMPDYAVLTSDAEGVGVALVAGDEGRRRRGALIYVAVRDLGAACLGVERAGGRRQSDVQTLPSIGRYVIVSDPDLNQLALFQPASG